MHNFKDITVLVTGGSSGIGEAITTAFAKSQANVAFTYFHSQEKAEKIVNSLESINKNVMCVPCNVMEANSIEQAIQSVQQRFGEINICINNAGDVFRRLSFLESDDLLWEDSFQINVMGSVRMSRKVLPAMMKKGNGRIISISSGAATSGGKNALHYGATKAALNTFSIGLAREVAGYGITVNVVSPGVIDTPLHQRVPSNDLADISKKIPAGRVGQPEEVASLVLFLASSEASYINGEVYRISGGN